MAAIPDAVASADTGTARWSLVSSDAAWDDALRRFPEFDTYHLKSYHRAAAAAEPITSEPFLFFYEHQLGYAVLPFTRRALDIAGGGKWSGLSDAISAYGYPGTLSTVQPASADSSTFRTGFAASIVAALRSLNIVCLFVRQNPLFETDWLWETIGEVQTLGNTVVIDLEQSIASQRSGYRKGHKWSLSLARRSGIEIRRREFAPAAPLFVEMYTATMQRVGAAQTHFFPPCYFEKLASCMPEHITVFEAFYEGDVCGAVLVLKTGRIAQYHLGAWREIGANISPIVPLIDAASDWARGERCTRFHLGGGVGALADSLFHFKQGFSKQTLAYKVVRTVVDCEAYKDISTADLHRRLANGFRPPPPGFFPPFRAASERA